MGLFDFFKKIIEKPETEQEKITFSEIEDWIKNKTKEIEAKEKDVLILIQEKINVFTNELKEKINTVRNVNIEGKKVEERIKFIVNEGREKYIESVNGFLDSLENLEECGLEKFIGGVNKVFLDFDKSSHRSYEKTTILIGKEMVEIKKSLKVFSGDLIKVFEENKDVVEGSKIVPFIKLKLDQITDIEENFEKIDKIISSLDEKISKREKENKKILEEIEKIKKSEEHIKNLERQEKIKLFEGELKKEIFGLRQLIDFKALTNFFHIFKEQMNLVKAYKEDFHIRFKKDNGEEIIKLLNEAKLNNKNISDKIEQINNKKEEKTKNKQEIKKDKTQKLYSETTKIILEMGNLKNEKDRKEKRREKLRGSKEEIVERIKNNLEDIGVDLDLDCKED